MLDYTKWDLKNEFTLEEAVCLWFEIDPNEKQVPPELENRVRELVVCLQGAGYSDFIDGITRDSAGFISLFGRKGLREFAEFFKVRPLFLFPEDRTAKGDHKDPEEWIRSLRVRAETDTEIIFQVSRKGFKKSTAQSMGFRDSKTKEWKALIDIIQDPEHLFQCGPSYHYGGGENKTEFNLLMHEGACWGKLIKSWSVF